MFCTRVQHQLSNPLSSTICHWLPWHLRTRGPVSVNQGNGVASQAQGGLQRARDALVLSQERCA